MLKLVPLNKANWVEISNLNVADAQRDFIPSNLFSIAESKFEPCEGYGIYEDTVPVGFLQICKFSGIYWISRLMIDVNHQGQGYGKNALKQAIRLVKQKIDAREIRTSIANQNKKAIALFEAEGFEPSMDMTNETVYRLEF